jgi:hypothetical protein
LDGDGGGVEEEAGLGGFVGEGAVFGEVAIGGVTDDGEAAFLALDAQLMSATGVGGEFEQGQDGDAGDDLELAHVAGGGFAFGTGLGAELAAVAFDLEVVFPEFLSAARDAEDEGEVGFFDIASEEAATEVDGEGGVGGEEDDAGGGGVEAVDEVNVLAVREGVALAGVVVGGV